MCRGLKTIQSDLRACCYCEQPPQYGIPKNPRTCPEQFYFIACWNELCKMQPYVEFDPSTTIEQSRSFWNEKMIREKQFMEE